MKKKISLRKVYAKKLSKLADVNKRIIVIDADSREATGINIFTQQHPNQSYCVGIAEQNMVSLAAGMSLTGLIPVINSYSMFLIERTVDQIRNTILWPELNVKLVGSHVGFDVGIDGVTHQTIEDLSIMRSLPNIVILNPADDIEMEQAVDFMIKYQGPVYLRTGKTKVDRFHNIKYKFRMGEPSIIKQGRDVALFSTGILLEETLNAAKQLEKNNISAMVINISTIKPINEKSIISIVKKTQCAVTIEDHTIYGGLGGAIAEITSKNEPIAIEMIGINDCFGETGYGKQLYQKYNMDEDAIIKAAKKAIKRKNLINN